ncbi:MAG TPA: DUF1015 domain-containing protein [Ktedonobacterales bacterium]|jgi:uncharacterized protein (DUF1015 family)|nr:DUF1015 domain-containing protein [Ktedonobacterales bacterium]
MADIRPLPGIRYAPGSDLAAVVTPPYDVISPEAQARYYERSPENIIRLELGRDEPDDDELDNRYTRAATTFADWRLRGVLQQDTPALYLYEQQFTALGGERRRMSLLARVRVEPWEAGVVLPHERTLSKPKSDRLKLTRATAATLSPIMALYDDPQGALAQALAATLAREPDLAFRDESDEAHRLWIIRDAELIERVAAFFRDRQLYIADGHHRYETALAYREELREARHELPLEDAVNFTLMALSAIEDPGLVVLPTHRIVRGVPEERLAEFTRDLAGLFESEPLIAGALNDLEEVDAGAVTRALADASDGGARTAFALIAPDGVRLLRQTDAGRAAMDERTGEAAHASEAWRALDVAVLHELVLARGLSVSEQAIRAGEHVTYTRDAQAALDAVRSGADGAQLAFLLNPTPPAAIRDVARAGDRMPQKSTYFYPKLITGLLINPLW